MPRIVATSELPLVAGTVRRLRGSPDPAAFAPVAPRARSAGARPRRVPSWERRSEERVDERRDGGALREHDERAEEREHEHDRTEPPLLADPHEGPELTDQREDTRTCHATDSSSGLPAAPRACQALEKPGLSRRLPAVGGTSRPSASLPFPLT